MENVRVFYLNHMDGLGQLKPLLIVEGEKIWNGAVKVRINSPMYYVFSGSLYIKLWRDKKGDLLYFFDNYNPIIFYDNEPEILTADLNLQWGVDTMWRIGEEEKKIKFSLPIFNVIRKIDEKLWRPTAYILGKMYYHSSEGQDSTQE